MIKTITKFFLTSTAIFGATQKCAAETYPLFLERQDGTVLEGYFSPPSTNESPIIFAIQDASCKSALKWFTDLSDKAATLGFGMIVLEKHGISQNGIDYLTYSQTNCLQQRQEDHILCLESMHLICPEWEGKPIFWGESEGGMLAANLASQTPQTAAVLLFGVGGGMKPREEVKWALGHRFEQQEAERDEVEAYMVHLDEQMNAMILDPTANKQFLGNTHKWWASVLAADEAVASLTRLSLPIYLVHGVEDSQTPVESADLASEMLEKTNALTYHRLEGRDHNVETADVRDAACRWLSAILLGRKSLAGGVATRVTVSERTSSKEVRAVSDHVLCKDNKSGGEGHGDVYGRTSADKDSNGNESASVEGGVRYHSDNGWDVNVSGGGRVSRDRDGNTRGEVHGKAEVSKGF